MAYNPTTDFLGLLRRTTEGVEQGRMPGMDYVLAALARAGVINIWSAQTAPTSDVTRTVWIKPAQPSWTAEALVYLWDGSVDGFVAATPSLWSNLLVASAVGNMPPRTIRGNALATSGPQVDLSGTQVVNMLPLPSELNQGAVPQLPNDPNLFLNGQGVFAGLPSSAGSVRLGIHLMQWGRAIVSNLAFTSIVFPTQFLDVPFVQVTCAASPVVVAAATGTLLPDQFTASVSGDTSRTIDWLAIGTSA